MTRFILIVLLLFVGGLIYSSINEGIEKRNDRWKKEIYDLRTEDWRLIEIHDSMMIEPETVEEKDYKVLINRLGEYNNENLESY